MSTGPVLGLLDTLTFPELMTFLVIALIVLGPEKLPGMARSAGRWVNKLRTISENLQKEVTGALDESEMQSLKELGEFAVRPRAKLAEYARKAALENDPDDPTDGDAPASSPPILPPLGVGPDNPMVTNAPAPATDEVGISADELFPAPEVDGSSAAVESDAPSPTDPTDPAPSPATDLPPMNGTRTEPSVDDT